MPSAGGPQTSSRPRSSRPGWRARRACRRVRRRPDAACRATVAAVAASARAACTRTTPLPAWACTRHSGSSDQPRRSARPCDWARRSICRSAGKSVNHFHHDSASSPVTVVSDETPAAAIARKAVPTSNRPRPGSPRSRRRGGWRRRRAAGDGPAGAAARPTTRRPPAASANVQRRQQPLGGRQVAEVAGRQGRSLRQGANQQRHLR